MQLTFQQKAARTIDQQLQLLTSQQSLIKMLKQQIRILQNEKAIQHENYFQSRLQLGRAESQIKSLKIELRQSQQNNQSLLKTFQAYKKECLELSPRLIKSSSMITDRNSKNGDLFLNIRNKLLISDNDNPSKQNINQNGNGKNEYEKKQSTYYQHYKYEFSEVYQRYWQTEILILLKQNQSNNTKLKSKIKSVVIKRFFPQQIRYILWSELIQNKLMINQRLFYLYLNKVKQSNIKQNIILLDLKRLNIRLDPKLGVTLLKDIEQCLYIFTYMRPDIGYVQGMPYFMWMLMIRMQKYYAFRCFTNLMVNDKLLSTLFNFQQQKIKKITNYFELNLKQKRNKSYRHLTNLNISMDIFLIQWAYTFYCRAFPLSMSSKIWDLWLSQDYFVFFKVGLTIFQIIQEQLIQTDYQNSVLLIRNCTGSMQQNDFFKIYRKQKLVKEDTLIL